MSFREKSKTAEKNILGEKMSKAKQDVHTWSINLPFDILSSLAKTCTLDLPKAMAEISSDWTSD